uniref:Uncharacterized protein n=1 Tax=Photobacterium damselae subsp. damselae TaxID=85581 RepID=E4WLG7_PHODD|nr:hypothetical protein [Photobacterium damselae subsp. damselae]
MQSLTADTPRLKEKGKNQYSVRFVSYNKYCKLDSKSIYYCVNLAKFTQVSIRIR